MSSPYSTIIYGKLQAVKKYRNHHTPAQEALGYGDKASAAGFNTRMLHSKRTERYYPLSHG